MSTDSGHRWFAALYDRSLASWERKEGARIRRDLLAGARGDVLEIGAGTGANFPHYPPNLRVVATEPDPHMRRRAEARAPAHVRVVDAPAERLPFDDASFDTVVSTLVLCSVADLPRTLAEIRRVLRPGGRFIFFEHVRSDGIAGRAQDLLQPAWGWFAGGCHINRRTEEAMRAAGLAFERIEPGRMRVLRCIQGSAHAAAPSRRQRLV